MKGKYGTHLWDVTLETFSSDQTAIVGIETPEHTSTDLTLLVRRVVLSAHSSCSLFHQNNLLHSLPTPFPSQAGYAYRNLHWASLHDSLLLHSIHSSLRRQYTTPRRNNPISRRIQPVRKPRDHSLHLAPYRRHGDRSLHHRSPPIRRLHLTPTTPAKDHRRLRFPDRNNVPPLISTKTLQSTLETKPNISQRRPRLHPLPRLPHPHLLQPARRPNIQPRPAPHNLVRTSPPVTFPFPFPAPG